MNIYDSPMKFNRWTPADKQNQLSDIAKGESILLYGTLDEKKSWLRKHPTSISTLHMAVQNNMTLRTSKKNFLSHMLSLYAHPAR